MNWAVLWKELDRGLRTVIKILMVFLVSAAAVIIEKTRSLASWHSSSASTAMKISGFDVFLNASWIDECRLEKSLLFPVRFAGEVSRTKGIMVRLLPKVAKPASSGLEMGGSSSRRFLCRRSKAHHLWRSS